MYVYDALVMLYVMFWTELFCVSINLYHLLFM